MNKIQTMEQGTNATPNENGANLNEDSKMFSVKVGTDANGEPIMQEVNEEEMRNGYLRQQNYTKKTQELAELKKKYVEPKGDETDEIKQTLAGLGFATKEDMAQYVANINKTQEEQSKLSSIMQTNPDLKPFEGAIKQIAKSDDSAIEDIIVKYGFSTHDKLKQAKESRGLVGNSNIGGNKQKTVAEMSTKEFADFKAKIDKKGDFR